jgi:hypothetical protein
METEILESTPTETLFADKEVTIPTEEPAKKSKFLLHLNKKQVKRKKKKSRKIAIPMILSRNIRIMSWNLT